MGLFGSKPLPSCSFPEHHGDDGGGMGGAVIVLAVAAFFVFVSVFAFALKLIAIGLVVASCTLMGGTVFILLRALHRRTVVSYQQAPPYRPVAQRQQPASQQVEGGQHVHVHLPPGMSPDQMAAWMRQIPRAR